MLTPGHMVYDRVYQYFVLVSAPHFCGALLLYSHTDILSGKNIQYPDEMEKFSELSGKIDKIPDDTER